MERLRFLSEDQVRRIQREFGTPVYVYDEQSLLAQAREALSMPNAYGLRVRYAMKALSTAAILRILTGAGLDIDASSGFEVARALRAGISPERIQVTAQEPPKELKELVEKGVKFNACSLHQLRLFGQIAPGREVSIRVNPGLGSGHSNRTNTGGPSASFGIWHQYLDEALAIQRDYGLRITRMHTHVGSGTDPDVWNRCARMSLDVAARLPEVDTLNLGGGFKVGRMADEQSTDLHTVGECIKRDFEDFAEKHGRKLKLEVEPGTYLVANAGALLCSVTDVVDTGADGYRFIKTDSGMTDLVRPSMYGAQHPIVVVPAQDEPRGTGKYLVVGHCCESGDVLTPEPGNPEGLAPRLLTEARIGDALVVGGAGAYSASMASKNYNSFPEAPEVLLHAEGTTRLIRQRQTLEQMLANEIID